VSTITPLLNRLPLREGLAAQGLDFALVDTSDSEAPDHLAKKRRIADSTVGEMTQAKLDAQLPIAPSTTGVWDPDSADAASPVATVRRLGDGASAAFQRGEGIPAPARLCHLGLAHPHRRQESVAPC
jgi:hypothetical protein